MGNFWKHIGVIVAAAAVSVFAGTAAEAAKDTLIVANTADIITLDPTQIRDNQSGNVRTQLFDGLLEIDAAGEVQPVLAERWEQPDPLTYVFYLRKGVKFHNGEELKAEDVKFSIDRALTPLGLAIHSLIRDIKEVNVLDDYTVEIKLKQPFTPFLYSLGESWGGILNKKAVETGDPDHHPIGTGPFKFVSWAKGDRVVLERFDEYYGLKPAYKNLIVRAIPESTSRMIELESGGIDVAYQITLKTDMERVQAHPELNLLRIASNRTGYIGMNTAKAPLNDVRVRQAIQFALDVPGLQAAVWRGIGGVPTNPIPPSNRYYDETLPMPKQDIEAAQKLLKEAGIALPLKLSLWTNESRERVDAATIVQSMLAEVGIEIEIRVLEWGTFLEGLKNGTQDLFLLGWGGNLPDAEFFFGSLYHSKSIPATNSSRYSNPEFDALLEKGTSTPDGPERKAVYVAAQRLFIKDAPAVYWSLEESIVGTSKKVKNFQMHPKGIYRLNTVTFEE